jgi:hypothetical protein
MNHDVTHFLFNDSAMPIIFFDQKYQLPFIIIRAERSNLLNYLWQTT